MKGVFLTMAGNRETLGNADLRELKARRGEGRRR